jgi:sugar-specific transcriptional regulator TrmB
MVDISQLKALTTYLRSLGFSHDEALIYVTLTEHGSSTPLQLARFTRINRTRVYRTVEGMANKKLATLEIGDHTTMISAAPLDMLEDIIRKKQQKAADLAREYPAISRVLDSLSAEQTADTKVKFYRGRHGIEQMVWNVLKAKSEVVGYTYRDLADFVGKKFMDEFAAEFVRRNLTMRDIYGDEYMRGNKDSQNWQGHIQSRYLSEKILVIPHQMDIYDDTVSFYNWQEGEVFGVEIYNPKVALHQKQLFELAWEKSKIKN